MVSNNQQYPLRGTAEDKMNTYNVSYIYLLASAFRKPANPIASKNISLAESISP